MLHKSGDSASLPWSQVSFFPFYFLPSSSSFSLPPFFFSFIFPLIIPSSFISVILSLFLSFPFSFFKNFVILNCWIKETSLIAYSVSIFITNKINLFNAYLVTCSLVNYIDKSYECRTVIHYWNNLTWSCFKICFIQIIF